MLLAMRIYQRHKPPCPEKSKKVRCRSCTFYADFRQEGWGIRSLKTKSEVKAHKKAEFISKTQSGESKEFKTAIEAWKNKLRLDNVSSNTQDHYLRLIEEQLQPWCTARGILTLDKITEAVVEEFRETKRNSKTGEPLAPTTVNKELADMKVFFKFAMRKGWMETNPVANIEPPVVADNEIIPYTSGEIIKIIAACEGCKNPVLARALILTMRWTGLRISDVVGLRRDNINGARLNLFAKKNHMHVRQKLNEETLNALAVLTADPEWPFYFVPKGWSYDAAYSEMRSLLDSVYAISGVANAKNHRFRHSFISIGLAAGNTERQMADMVGITETVLRKHYSKWMKEREERSDEASDRIFQFEAQRYNRELENGTKLIQ